MKKITVSIACDEEKLSALKMYLAQKDMRVETELEKVKRVITMISRDEIDMVLIRGEKIN